MKLLQHWLLPAGPRVTVEVPRGARPLSVQLLNSRPHLITEVELVADENDTLVPPRLAPRVFVSMATGRRYEPAAGCALTLVDTYLHVGQSTVYVVFEEVAESGVKVGAATGAPRIGIEVPLGHTGILSSNEPGLISVEGAKLDSVPSRIMVAILATLAEGSADVDALTIAATMPDVPSQQIRSELSRLTAVGKLDRVERGRYRLPKGTLADEDLLGSQP